MGFYDDMAQVAADVLGEFRQGAVTLTRLGAETAGPNPYDPPTREEDQVFTLSAVVAAVTIDQANAKYIDGTVITTADLVITCAVPPVLPAMTDIVSVDGKVRTIKKIVQVPAAGVPVAFKLFVQG